jgi:hypothetical protein
MFAAPTPGMGQRVRGMISALVGTGIADGYLANPRLAKVHWQAVGRPLPHRGWPWPENRRCGSTPLRSVPPTTLPSSAMR